MSFTDILKEVSLIPIGSSQKILGTDITHIDEGTYFIEGYGSSFSKPKQVAEYIVESLCKPFRYCDY
jgi:hypothetical protein